MIEQQEEMKCPKCGGDMKEYVTCFKCRRNGMDGSCEFVFKSFFHSPIRQIQSDHINSPVEPLNDPKEVRKLLTNVRYRGLRVDGKELGRSTTEKH